MKKILFAVITFLSFAANAQQKNLYKLKKPIEGFDTTFYYIKWYMVDYPQSYNAYWCIVKDTSLNLCAIDGNYNIPQEIINTWGADDNVIPEYLEKQKVWANKKD